MKSLVQVIKFGYTHEKIKKEMSYLMTMGSVLTKITNNIHVNVVPLNVLVIS